VSQGFGAKKKMEGTTGKNKTDQQRINFRLRLATLQITELALFANHENRTNNQQPQVCQSLIIYKYFPLLFPSISMHKMLLYQSTIPFNCSH
jgi:hypothetical protein